MTIEELAKKIVEDAEKNYQQGHKVTLVRGEQTEAADELDEVSKGFDDYKHRGENELDLGTSLDQVTKWLPAQRIFHVYQATWTIEQIARGEFLIRHLGEYRGTEGTLQEAQDKIDRLISE